MNYLLHPKTWSPLLTKRHLIPWRHVTTIADLSSDALKEQGIKGLIFDVDNTLTEHHAGFIFPKVKAAFERFKQDFSVVIYSNCGPKRHNELKDIFKGLPLVDQGLKKPLPNGFEHALSLFTDVNAKRLKAESIAMVGDRVLTDIVGGNRAGFKTILVDPFSTNEPYILRTMRWLERARLG